MVGSGGLRLDWAVQFHFEILIFAGAIIYLNEEIKDVFLELPPQAHTLRTAYRFKMAY